MSVSVCVLCSCGGQYYDVVFSSTLARAIQTALAASTVRPVMLLYELTTLMANPPTVPCYRRNTTSIIASYGTAVNASLISPDSYPPKALVPETESNFVRRVFGALSRVVELLPPGAKRVLIVCHGHVISRLTSVPYYIATGARVSLDGSAVAC